MGSRRRVQGMRSASRALREQGLRLRNTTRPEGLWSARNARIPPPPGGREGGASERGLGLTDLILLTPQSPRKISANSQKNFKNMSRQVRLVKTIRSFCLLFCSKLAKMRRKCCHLARNWVKRGGKQGKKTQICHDKRALLRHFVVFGVDKWYGKGILRANDRRKKQEKVV